jgi:hypothetical protein
MEFKDVQAVLYDAFFSEYSCSRFFRNGDWSVFINNKNIGLMCIEGGVYKVVDEKKWVFARLKYGI